MFWQLYFKNPLLFIRESIANWREVGSIFPSSAPLRKALIKLATNGQKHFDLVILHGIGSGEFIYELLRQAYERELSVSRLVAMDINTKFISNASRLLVGAESRYPSDTLVVFEKMDALSTPEYLAKHNLPRADLVIGTIPYSNLLKNDLDGWAGMYARVTRRFAYYTYLPELKPNGKRAATGQFISLLKKYFSEVSESAPIYANLPPAKVIVAEQPKI